ncbi:hypothetical protein [Dietzia sp. ANT_WB102]|uniref:hypothetical protein n=1 Tax=Dietzia sp. ANT_WB102 TaxID=2597345 RepID=UPI002101DC82|nr:hypothetical protein [Dietzia sp. ANT_WB102]
MHQSQGDREPQGDRTTFCEAPAAYIVETYFVLRMVIAGGAVALPPALLVWAVVDRRVDAVNSISAFYYTPARGLFVGTLVAIGVALVAYRGYTRGENRLLNAAGMLAMVVALFPTEDPALPGLNAVSVIHAVAAVSFFVLAALSILFYGQQTISSIPNRDLQRSYLLGYRILVVLLLLLPALALLIAWVMDSTMWLFLVETAALYAFATFWIVKTYELKYSHVVTRVV